MQIQPRYDGPPVLTLDGGDGPDAGGVGVACTRQRRRLLDTLAALGADDWRAPSRCDGWTVQDVVAHLDSVNRFWHWSITAGLDGAPTRVLEGFDPKATPAALVDAAPEATPAEALAQLTAGTEALCEAIAGIDGDQWSTLAEAPAGHIPIRLVVHHALWDCWVHERDIALPLGLPVIEEPDEVLASLRFVAALGPSFALATGSAQPSTLVLETTDPEARVVVEVTDRVAVRGGTGAGTGGADDAAASATVVLRDDAVALLEAFSVRAPFATPVPDEHRWLVASLAVVFEA